MLVIKFSFQTSRIEAQTIRLRIRSTAMSTCDRAKVTLKVGERTIDAMTAIGLKKAVGAKGEIGAVEQGSLLKWLVTVFFIGHVWETWGTCEECG